MVCPHLNPPIPGPQPSRRLVADLRVESGAGSHCRPTQGGMEPTRAFDFCDSAIMKPQPATSADGKDLGGSQIADRTRGRDFRPLAPVHPREEDD
jgi:hypothetical protein